MITEENFVDFKCPWCEEAVSFPQTDAGFARACPNCQETVIVPEDGAQTGGKPPLPITTERLVLRRFAPGDWKDLLEFVSDESLFRYTGGGPMEEDDVLGWLELDSQVKLTTPDNFFYLGIEVKDGAKLIGYIGLRLVDALQAGLNVVVSPAYQRKGYGTEAMVGLLGFCFAGIKLHRVKARCDGRNIAGCKLFEKAGLRREGEAVKDTLTQEGWINTVWYAALEEEFRGR